MYAVIKREALGREAYGYNYTPACGSIALGVGTNLCVRRGRISVADRPT